MYTCPVCGFDRLEDPPNNYTICPSCGTEFEYDDVRTTKAELRRAWVAGGYKWWSKLEQPPARWNPERQLKELIHPELREVRTVPAALSASEMQILLAVTGIGANQSTGSWPEKLDRGRTQTALLEVLGNVPRQRSAPGVLKEAWT
jgi:hypothetical protein